MLAQATQALVTLICRRRESYAYNSDDNDRFILRQKQRNKDRGVSWIQQFTQILQRFQHYAVVLYFLIVPIPPRSKKMDAENPTYFQNEYEASQRIKSRSTNHVASVNSNSSRKGSLQQSFSMSSRRRSELTNSRSQYVGDVDGVIRGDTSMSEQQKANRSIPEKVAQFYYALGLFCSSHSVTIIILASIVVTISCYPLFSLPFLGHKPKEFVTPYENYSSPPFTGFEGEWPRWYRGPPSFYIQQIIVKSAIIPWTPDMWLTDAFRGPLSEVFQITELLKEFNVDNNGSSLGSFCFSVGEVKSRVLKGKISMLPEFGCLLVSPADFWQQKFDKFREDPDILGTILNYQSHQKGRSGLAEILLGMSVRDTGFKRYPLKARPRIVSYAITFVLQTFDHKYIDALRTKLTKAYSPTRPLLTEFSGGVAGFNSSSKTLEDRKSDDDLNIIHVYYPSQSSILELIPLVVTYIAMFIYVYFSVKKIEIITSKLGMAITALATVVASLCMSVGLCSHFGMTFEVNAKAIYPYLVVIIGLENILVLTRSVVSTAKNLDVKIRVAQGLSKEGWGITKNILTEITILTIGFFTFMPAVQEFCILAIVGLLSDFFLQTFFFATVLSIDIHRQKFNSNTNRELRYGYAPLRTPIHPSDVSGMHRIKSNPQIKPDQNGTLKKSSSGISVVAPLHNTPILVKIPKRLRLVYFWARTRFFQRMFTIFMVGWISVIIYESGIVARFGPEPEDVVLPLHQDGLLLNNNVSQSPLSMLHSSNEKYSKPLVLSKSKTTSQNGSIVTQNNKILRELYSHNPYIWRRLTTYHWQVLFGVYNVSLTGGYISILPSICISVAVQPKIAIEQRHPNELQQARRFNWQALANAFDAIDLVDDYDSVSPTGSPLTKTIKKGVLSPSSDDPYIPSSPVELALTVLVAIPSIFFIAYLFVVLYRCICSRNYAEWRSSWAKANDSSQDGYTQVVFEAVPLVLDGHSQDVECISSDGNIIASVCLAGVLKVWHTSNGENAISVDRQRYFEQFLATDKDECYGTWVPSDADSSGCSPPDLESPLNKFRERPNSSGSLKSPSGYMNTSLDRNNVQNNLRKISSSERNQYDPTAAHKGIPIPGPGSRNFGSPSSSSPNSYPGHGSMKKLADANGQTICVKKSDLMMDPDPGSTPFTTEDNPENAREGSIDSIFIEDVPSVWCLDCMENLIFLGTGTGRLEIWDALNGTLKCVYEDGTCAGIVCIKVIGNKIISARLNGCLDFLEIESSLAASNPTDSPSPYHRWGPGDIGALNPEFGHTATFSIESDNEIRCNWLMTQKAHQQPITCLDCEGGRILTGSQDHTLKVFRVEDHLPLYTLHGHYGPITCLFIDKFSPMTSGSGSHDGMLCVWDLLTGMCMYSIQAHDGPISSITYSASYIISVGGDDKICVWERFQGHLLHNIQLDHAYSSSLVMLTQNLLITSKQGSLIVWDVRSGQPVRAVRLGHRDNAVFVRQIIGCADAVICDYGSQLRLVRFPSVISKYD